MQVGHPHRRRLHRINLLSLLEQKRPIEDLQHYLSDWGLCVLGIEAKFLRFQHPFQNQGQPSSFTQFNSNQNRAGHRRSKIPFESPKDFAQHRSLWLTGRQNELS
jgi:hypothetical protein